MGRAITALLLAALAAGPAAAAPPEAQVSLELDAEPAARCPDEAALRALVVERLGRDPFGEPAVLAIRVTIRARTGGVAARIEARSPYGGTPAERELAAATCDALTRAVALWLALVVEGLPPPEPKPEPEPEAEPEPPPPPAEDTEEPPAAELGPTITRSVAPRRGRRPLGLRAGAGVLAHYGLLPAPGEGLGVQAQLRHGALSVGFELRYDVAAAVDAAGGRIRASLVSGTAGVCLHRGRLAACGLAAAGRLEGEGEGFTTTARAVAPWVAAGGRIAWELPLSRRVAAQLRVDVQDTLVRTRLRVTGDPEGGWTAPALSFGAGVAFLGRFW